MNRANNIPFLRLILAIIVMIRHFIVLNGETIESGIRFLSFSIFIFFILSGMLVFASFEKNPEIKTYFKKRFLRIYPAYAFVIVFFSIILVSVSQLGFSDYFSGDYIRYLISNLAFLNFLQPCINDVFSNNAICAINGSLWTLKIEVGFYLLLPIMYWILKSYRYKTQNIILISIYLLACLYFYYLAEIKDNYLYAKQLPGAMMYFASGMLLYRNYHFLRNNIKLFTLPAVVIIVLHLWLTPIYVLFPISLAILVFWLSFSLRTIDISFLKADLSYGIFLFHFPIIQLFAHWEITQQYPILAFILVLIITIGLAYFSWNILEKSFIKRK
ncbi:acyltransferase family protein [Bergeyella porcorum]|uniref:acyltransferase family protein n=1 Tax=Bergeyella porcorum TaxID=1735111 RepID=UPI0035EA73AB